MQRRVHFQPLSRFPWRVKCSECLALRALQTLTQHWSVEIRQLRVSSKRGCCWAHTALVFVRSFKRHPSCLALASPSPTANLVTLDLARGSQADRPAPSSRHVTLEKSQKPTVSRNRAVMREGFVGSVWNKHHY